MDRQTALETHQRNVRLDTIFYPNRERLPLRYDQSRRSAGRLSTIADG